MSTRSDRIPLSEPVLGGNARKYLLECLETNFVSSVGPFVQRFEQEFAERLGARYAVACASGTAAIHVALRVLGVDTGDEVLLPTLTFIASANPVLYQHGVPVLIDSEPRSWNMDPDLVVAELVRRDHLGLRQPAAVEVVHILGEPADIEPIADACARYGVPLFEDAAESLGATYTTGKFAGRGVGTIGSMGCFSFNGNKVMTTGGGGMIVTDDAEMARRAKHLTTQARLPGLEYNHDEVGYNYRLTNLAAALGVAQLEQLSSLLEAKRLIAERYDAALSAVPGISTAPGVLGAVSSNWLYTIQVDPAVYGMDWRALHERLLADGIDTRPIWAPLHLMPPLKDAPYIGGQVAEGIFSRALSLPSSANLAPAAQDRVIDGILRYQALTPSKGHV